MGCRSERLSGKCVCAFGRQSAPSNEVGVAGSELAYANVGNTAACVTTNDSRLNVLQTVVMHRPTRAPALHYSGDQ